MSHFNEYTTFYLRTMKTDSFSCSIIRSSQPRKLFKKGALKLQIAEQIGNCKLQIADCRLQSKSMDWFLYNNALRHERVKKKLN